MMEFGESNNELSVTEYRHYFYTVHNFTAMKIAYRKIALSKANKERLQVINEIIDEYAEDGYVLTLRQLYYQLVSRDIIPNDDKEYKKVGKLLMEGRMAGIVDWDAIEDRTRRPSKPSSWDSPKEIIRSAASQFRLDRMAGQFCNIEVWVEKDALSGVLSRITEKYGVYLQVNRGYGSVSALHDAWERVLETIQEGNKFYLLYLGDHDPSGLDMIRDIESRLFEFAWGGFYHDADEPMPRDFQSTPYFDNFINERFEIVPIALTMDQIRLYNPPPNPAKITDSRADEYIRLHGDKSWEVDALRPEILNTLLEDSIKDKISMIKFEKQMQLEKDHKARLQEVIENWVD